MPLCPCIVSITSGHQPSVGQLESIVTQNTLFFNTALNEPRKEERGDKQNLTSKFETYLYNRTRNPNRTFSEALQTY